MHFTITPKGNVRIFNKRRVTIVIDEELEDTNTAVFITYSGGRVNDELEISANDRLEYHATENTVFVRRRT